MREFEVCWTYEQDFATIIEGNSEKEVRQKFLDGDFDSCVVDENDGSVVDGSLEVFDMNDQTVTR